MATIKSSDYKTVFPKDIDIPVDLEPKFGDPVIALMVEPGRGGPSFIVPMDLNKARDMAVMVLDTLMKVSPAFVL